MTRRKSLTIKWTLVLLVSVCFPNVYTRPQDSASPDVISSTNSALKEPTEHTPRYRFRDELNSSNIKLPIIVSVHNNNSQNITKLKNILLNVNSSQVYNKSTTNRRSRVLRKKYKINQKLIPKIRPNHESKPEVPSKSELSLSSLSDDPLLDKTKSTIRKVLTKWADESKYVDLKYPHDIKTSDETDTITFIDSENDTPGSKDQKAKIKYTKINHNQYYTPTPEYSDESHTYSNNVHLIDYPVQRPHYSYTVRPNPTPVVTNVGYPEPWPQNPQHHRKTTTRKPAPVTEPLNDYHYHNSIHNYPNFDSTTFQSTPAYTEKIIIRPEEYSASPDECPTIYLTLNNTFQGQGKEACPDLNIAVNTNVINKNVVIESEEDDTDGLIPGGFGLPLGDDSANDESGNDYFQSEENQGENDSASGEEAELTNYNTGNAVQSESAEPGGMASPSSHFPVISKPSRPNSDDDDLFGFTSLIDFFRPAMNALGWLASINPLMFGLIPLLLTPLAFLFAGSGIAALFSSWFLPYGREAPEIIHIYKPSLHWQDRLRNWHVHSFPETRRVRPELKGAGKDLGNRIPSKRTLLDKLQNWMKAAALKFKDIDSDLFNNHKSKRRKRTIWLRRSKE